MIWAVRHGAAAPPHAACTTSPHPTPIASHGSSHMPAPQRANLPLEVPSAACDRVMDTHAVPMQTHPVHKTFVRAHVDLILTGRRGAEIMVDQEWWRRTSSSSPPRSFCDILFVGGHEAVPPVRCAPPSPVLRPRCGILCRFGSITHPLACASAGLSRSTRALLTSLALRRKPSGTSNSMQQPRAPPAELTRDVAGRASEVGSNVSHGGRLSVGCLRRLFLVGAVPPGHPRRL